MQLCARRCACAQMNPKAALPRCTHARMETHTQHSQPRARSLVGAASRVVRRCAMQHRDVCVDFQDAVDKTQSGNSKVVPASSARECAAASIRQWRQWSTDYRSQSAVLRWSRYACVAVCCNMLHDRNLVSASDTIHPTAIRANTEAPHACIEAPPTRLRSVRAHVYARDVQHQV